MGQKIAYYFVPENNPDAGFYPGVPLDHVTQEEFDALPEHLQNTVDASPFYRKTKPADVIDGARPETAHITAAAVKKPSQEATSDAEKPAEAPEEPKTSSDTSDTPSTSKGGNK